MASDETHSEQCCPPDRLTWAVLLGRWVSFARGALALPDDAEGRRLRASVPDIIMLQAVWFALQDLHGLDAEQRAVGIDRAALLIDRHGEALAARWGPAMPPLLREVLEDARRQLAAVSGG